MEEKLVEITSILPQKEKTISEVKKDFNSSEVLNTVKLIYNHNIIDNRLWIRIYVNQISSNRSNLLLRPFDIFYQPQTTNNLNRNTADVVIYFRDAIKQFETERLILTNGYNIENISALTDEDLINRIERL